MSLGASCNIYEHCDVVENMRRAFIKYSSSHLHGWDHAWRLPEFDGNDNHAAGSSLGTSGAGRETSGAGASLREHGTVH